MTQPLHKSRIFQLLLLAFVLGTLAGNFFDLHRVRIFLYSSGIVAVVMVTVFGKQRVALISIGVVMAILAGMWRLQATAPVMDSSHVASVNESGSVVWEGIVAAEPDVRADKVNYTVQATRLHKPIERSVNGLVLVTAGLHPQYQYGDRLRISGKLQTPFETEDFSYKKYLAQKNMYSVMRFGTIERVATSQGNVIIGLLLRFKSRFIEVLSHIVPEPHQGLLLGLLVGARQALPADLLEAFKITGVTHIIAISGFNISIITRIVGRAIQQQFGPRIALAVCVLVVAGFVVITGGAASVVRAAIMGLLAVVALNVGRANAALNALVFTGAIMVALSPRIIQTDIGFQLSFLATAGLIFFAEPLEQLLRRVPDVLELRTTLAATIAAQVFVLPLLIGYFDRLSVVAPLVNVLILPTIPLTMLLGFVAGLCALLWPMLGFVPGWLAWAFLNYQIVTIRWFAAWPYAAIAVSGISLPWMVSYYALLLIGVFIVNRRQRQQAIEAFVAFEPRT